MDIMVKAYGSSTGARLIDVGRTGKVIGRARKRYIVSLDYGNGMPAEIRNIERAVLRFL